MEEHAKGGFYIAQIKQIQERIFEKLLKEHRIENFNGAQGRILYVLWQEDQLTIGELGRRTSLSKSTLTSMLDRMEKQGHIQRQDDPGDRRQIRIALTPQTRALNEQYNEVSRKMSAVFYRGLSTEEIIRLDQALEKILENLKDYEGKNDGK